MIMSFKCKETEKVFNKKFSKKFSAEVNKIGQRKLDMIHAAFKEQDLLIPPANRYENFKGNLKGYSSIRINNQFRIVFKFINNNAEGVYITDYH